MQTVYSIGYGNRDLKFIVQELCEAGIMVLVDVRSRPYSKYQPDFNKDHLREILTQNGIEYRWLGRNLGGLDGNVEHEETLDRLSEEIMFGEKRFAVMCSETKPENCHRALAGGDKALQPKFEARGLAMEHLAVYSKKQAVKEAEKDVPQLGLF